MPSKGPGWIWDTASRRYRDTTTGRYINQRTLDGLRDTFIDAQKERIDTITDRLVAGDTNVQQWVLEMRKAIKDTYITEYSASRGGVNNVTQAEWGRTGQQLRQQYEYLNKFAQDVIDGKLSPGQINARAKLYIESASQIYERGKVENTGIPALPAYPGDGQTVCRANCRCHWRIVETDAEWQATWKLGAAEHCPDCVVNAGRWAPLRFAK